MLEGIRLRFHSSSLPVAASCALGLACAGPVVTLEAPPASIDGLVPAEIDIPGTLLIRKDHGIGSYDEFFVPPAQISYERSSVRLPREMEVEFLATLEQSLIDLSLDASIPVVDEPGMCVMQVGLSLLDVHLDAPGGELRPDRMTLVMEFRDSLSGQPLLRFATVNSMERQDSRVARSERLRRGFDQMLDRMDVGPALQAAGLGGQPIREECNGTLEARGREAALAVGIDVAAD